MVPHVGLSMKSRGFIPLFIPVVIAVGIVVALVATTSSAPAAVDEKLPVPSPLVAVEKTTESTETLEGDSPVFEETDSPSDSTSVGESANSIEIESSNTIENIVTSTQTASIPTTNETISTVYVTQSELTITPAAQPPEVIQVSFPYNTQYSFEGALVDADWYGFASVYTYPRNDDWFTLVFSNPNTSNNTPISSNPTTEEFISKFEYASIQLNLTPLDSEWETKIQLAARDGDYPGYKDSILANLAYENNRLSGVVETTLTQTTSYRKECLPLPQGGPAPPGCIRILSHAPTPLRIVFSLEFP